MSNLLTSQEREDLQSQLELQNELDRRLESNRIKWYTPNGTAEEFINKIGAGDVFIGIFSAANGVGKTATMANILGNIILGEKTENPWFNLPLFRNFKFPHRGRIASSKKNLEEVGAIQTELKKWLPAASYKSTRQGKQYDSLYEMGDWVFDIMSYDQDVKEYESATLGIMIFDEPPPLRIFYACIARMRKGGIILIFMTPLDEGGILLEDLTKKDVLEYEGHVLGKVATVYADIEENCKQHGTRGHLEHGHIMQMVAFYTPEEKEARMNGRPSHNVGRIYSEFDVMDPMVVNDFLINNEDYTLVQIVDPHDAIPFAMIWVALDRTGQGWVYDEFPEEDLDKIKSTNLTYPKYGTIIRDKEARSRAHHRIIDPYFGNKTFGNTGKTPKQEFSDLGFDFIDGDTSGLDLGHNRVREWLKYDRLKPVSSINHCRLHIMKKCRNTWRSMYNYKRKLPTSGEVKDKAVIEETYKHHCDCIRHLIMKYDDVKDKPETNVGFQDVATSY